MFHFRSFPGKTKVIFFQKAPPLLVHWTDFWVKQNVPQNSVPISFVSFKS